MVTGVSLPFLLFVAILLPFAAEDREVGPPEQATFVAEQSLLDDDGAELIWILQLADDTLRDMRARSGPRPDVGDPLCVRQLTGATTGVVRLRFVGWGECPS
ncbi:MAG: hypothetical protein AAF674_06510 [Pseudomonadota bacterium]